MFEKTLKLLEENHIAYQVFGGELVYIPQRIGYKFRITGNSSAIQCYNRESAEYTHAQTDEGIAEVIENLIKQCGKSETKQPEQEDPIEVTLQNFDKKIKPLSSVARNLNLLAVQGKIFRAYGREKETRDVLRNLLRKTKPNTLLTGKAGCGKTAIVENLAFYINELKAQGNSSFFSDMVIYDLNITALTSGTKYRGEFEEKLRDIIQICRDYPNIVLFIDEIHQLNDIGSCKGGSNMGQLLKPALARGDVRCIGATTTEESAILLRDKALARRFNEVIVEQLSGENALQACDKILTDYSQAHKVEVQGIAGRELYDMAMTRLSATAFPDNFINLIDETMADACMMGKAFVEEEDFLATAERREVKNKPVVTIGFC